MIKSNHHMPTLWFFYHFFRIKMKFHFRGIEVVGDVLDLNKPVLLLQNHFSWWDGYWALYLSRNYFKKKFHVMMLEEQIRNYKFMQRCGAFSVKKNSKDVIQSLQFAKEILQNPYHLVCLFPQGEIQSQHVQGIQFQKGAEWLCKQMLGTIQILFCVALVDYKSSPKPLVRLYVQEFSNKKPEELESSYNLFRNECIKKQDN